MIRLSSSRVGGGPVSPRLGGIRRPVQRGKANAAAEKILHLAKGPVSVTINAYCDDQPALPRICSMMKKLLCCLVVGVTMLCGHGLLLGQQDQEPAAKGEGTPPVKAGHSN